MPPVNGLTKYFERRFYKHLVPTGRKQTGLQSMCFMLELTPSGPPSRSGFRLSLNPRHTISGFGKLHKHHRIMSRHDQIGPRRDLLHSILCFEI